MKRAIIHELSVLLFIFLHLAVLSSSFAQSSVGKIELDKIIPPSPEAVSFAKYGDIPVSLATGTIAVSIPIYTIDAGGLKIPISLSYHGSGIKVNDISSAVGLGWVLNAGGLISRTVVGKADDMWSGSSQNGGYIFNDNSNVTRAPESFDDTQSDAYFLRDVTETGIIDTEPDIFNYNFLDHAGRKLGSLMGAN